MRNVSRMQMFVPRRISASQFSRSARFPRLFLIDNCPRRIYGKRPKVEKCGKNALFHPSLEGCFFFFIYQRPRETLDRFSIRSRESAAFLTALHTYVQLMGCVEVSLNRNGFGKAEKYRLPDRCTLPSDAHS